MTAPAPWIAAEAGDTARRHAPATLRNRDAIADILATILPAQGMILEIASGSGEHCACFAGRFPGLTWQPSDHDPAARASIAAWSDGIANIRPPLTIDAATHLQPLISSLFAGLASHPKMASSCCWALMNLADRFAGAPGCQTNALSAHFQASVTHLLQVTERYALPSHDISISELIDV